MISKELIDEVTRGDRNIAALLEQKNSKSPQTQTQPNPSFEEMVTQRVAEPPKLVQPNPKRHQVFEVLRLAVGAKVNVFLVGPAGSGKTTVAKQVAQSLGLPFYFNGAIQSEYKLTGFRDAQGKVHRTAFRDAFERGGVYLFDEIDASQPAALLAFNAALANGMFDFPDRNLQCHHNFRCIAAANTWGRGATIDYVGRSALDAATLDRFATLEMRYDPALERRMAQIAAKGDNNLAAGWLEVVQKTRAMCIEHDLRHIVSPRATQQGLSLMTGGITAEGATIMVLRRGLDDTSWGRIRPRIHALVEQVEMARKAMLSRNKPGGSEDNIHG
ncbi:MAG: AAA family ATPase [Steroidobacteraceae bacterium]